MERVLVTGANGQLGVALQNCTVGMDGFTFFFTDIDRLDICNRELVGDFLRMHNIDVIINCAAYTAVDRAEDEPDICARINCEAVRSIGEVAASVEARVIHISTDYVFDGQALGTPTFPLPRYWVHKPPDRFFRPYHEMDETHPLSVYGKTKLAGEQALLAACNHSMIIRTAWLYSATGTNFVKTMLRLGAERDTLNIVADQYGTPTYAGDLAEAIKTILTANSFTPGIYHYTNDGVCTWYDFAAKIFQLAGIKCVLRSLTTAEYPTRAIRPAYSVLDKTKIKQVYAVPLPAWEASLAKFIQNQIVS